MPKLRLVVASAATLAIAFGGSSCGSSSSSEDSPKDSADAIPALNEKLPKDIRESGTLIVATDPAYPPCDFINDSGEIDGFNRDIMEALASRLGIELKYEKIAFDGLLPGVTSGRFDTAVECITDTAERQETVKFVDYIYGTESMMVLEGNPRGVSADPLSTCGLKAGVQTGTQFPDDAENFSKNCEKNGKAPIEVTHFPSAGDQNTALQSGRVDFVFTNTATAVWQSTKESDGVFEVISDIPALPKLYLGIVVDHGADDLAEALLAALEASIEDGSYEKILAEWGLEDTALLEPGINLATERPLETPTL